MTFLEFCNKYRIKQKIDVDQTPIAQGLRGHIYEYSEDEMGVILMMKSARGFGFAFRRLLAAGCILRQQGDSEGSASFSPSNVLAVKAAIREAKIRLKPVLSLEQREILRQRAQANLVKA